MFTARAAVRTIVPILVALSLASGGASAVACPPDDSSAAACEVASLRSLGPAGLQSLLDEYDRAPSPALAERIDAVAAQKDAAWSRLYWYTSLEQAKSAAKASGKPILYLRLLGKLTDEYSCANSRFFRTVLYANKGVSQLLRDRFICVWESERPVPVVTIDFGDGRVLKRTVTGNSAHYVLDGDGRVIDVAPGLMDPVTFTGIITAAADYATATGRPSYTRYIASRLDALRLAWQADGGGAAEAQQALAAQQAPPDAGRAAPRALGKMAVEAPIVRALSPQAAASLDRAIDSADAARWSQVAARHLGDARLDARSAGLMVRHLAGHDEQAARLTIESFQRLIAEDTVRNNYKLRRQVLEWLAGAPGPVAASIPLADLNARVYAELFLTPRSDPWLGLRPAGEYAALGEDGCVLTGDNNAELK